VVGGTEQETVGLVLFEELEKRVQHPAELAHFMPGAALSAESVELVKQIHAARGLHGVEDQAQLRRRLAEVLRNQPVELNAEERQAELAG
jgi:hypothetical protein